MKTTNTMSKTAKIWMWVIIAALLIGGGVWYYQYQKKKKAVAEVKAPAKGSQESFSPTTAA